MIIRGEILCGNTVEDHVEISVDDFRDRNVFTGIIPAGKPVAHAEDTVSYEFGVLTGLETA